MTDHWERGKKKRPDREEQLQERETEQVKLETRKGPGRLSGILLGSDFAPKINRREG